MEADLEQRAIDVIRGLCMDGPQAANSGHPGTGMALAPLAHVLWTRSMRYDAGDPHWPDRDRFVLSAGHASILLYSMLYLTGAGDLTLDDLRQFRQWGSKTPGHPEVHHTVGVEVTTGPLGQGVANGVGMGVAERFLRARFGPELCDHHTFVICGDGDLEEGISHEAASLAGHLGLGRLVYVYDDNHITIDGDTALSYSDDAALRFEAYGWHVEKLGEVANDTGALEAAIERAKAVDDKPSLLVLRSHIGYPSPKYTDTEHAHGNPLGEDEVRVTKELMGLPPEQTFYVPDDVLDLYRTAGRRNEPARLEWEARRDGLPAEQRTLWDACLEGRGLEGWAAKLPTWSIGDKTSTRKASGACLAAVVDVVPGIVGGGADLTGNTNTVIKDEGVQSADEPGGRQVYFGIREHGMGGIMNGMALHGGTLPLGGTFFVFSDYMRGAVRLAALSEAHVVYAWTHDSVGLGEDGPTHQPIEHLAALRAMPQLRLIRPADANETAVAWEVAVDEKGPTALVLSRQDIPVVTTPEQAAGLKQGAYVLADSEGAASPDDLDVVLVGTGSEVAVCLEAKPVLEADGLKVRVVSMPCWELFALLDDDAQEAVLPSEVPTLAVEAGTSFGWDRWADDAVAIDHFGASAPGSAVLANFGYTAGNVAARARHLIDELEG